MRKEKQMKNFIKTMSKLAQQNCCAKTIESALTIEQFMVLLSITLKDEFCAIQKQNGNKIVLKFENNQQFAITVDYN